MRYESTAVDSAMFEELDEQPSLEDVVTEATGTPTQIVEQPVLDTPTESATVPEPNISETNVNPTAPTVYHVEGVGDFTAEQIRELQQGSLRQSDYTRKTQELARQREELAEAKAFYEQVKSNPQLQDQIRQENPVVQMPSVENDAIRQMRYELKSMEADMKMNELKSRYGNVDEVAIYQKAAELKTDDFDFVYRALNYQAPTGLSEREIIEKAKAELRAELQQNKDSVSTVVTTTNQTPLTTAPPSLTADEKRIASAFGMSEGDYNKWKN